MGALVIAATASGCSSPDEPTLVKASVSATSIELAPGALVEGPKTVIGLRIPIGAEVGADSGDYAVWSINNRSDIVSNYIRERVEGDAVVGPRRTVFDRVTLKGADVQDLKVTIMVEPSGFGTRVLMRRR